MPTKPGHPKRLLHTILSFSRPRGVGSAVEVEPVPITVPQLPVAFRLARIAVVADMHLPDSLLTIPALLRLVAAQRPDAVFVAGDLTNSYTDFDSAGLEQLAQGLAAIAPCFAIPGNHELRGGREEGYAAILRQAGVTCLHDSAAVWEKDGDTLPVFGMARQRPRPLPHPTLVLAHKPDYFPYYAQARWDVVVCGHAHGGQIRVKQRSVYAPGQGVLPAYTSGLYREGTTRMIVSRGLGNSSVPLRIGNRPHLPVLILLPDET